jgi:septum formation protein
MPLPPPLILASASPRRSELLRLLAVPFEVVPSAYEEHMPETHPDPAALAIHLATEKARDVATRGGRLHGPWVLGADTIVALGARLYGKPRDTADAHRMLRELSGQTHEVVTGVALLRAGEAEVHAFATRTEVTFRTLEPAEIEAYVATGEPADKAGAYAIQGHGAMLIEGIRGDYPNVVGLPLMPLGLLLRRLGVLVLGLSGG